MHVVVTGATGNVGTALLQALLDDPAVERITGIARRAPAMRPERVHWVAADVAEADLIPAFDGADAVVHLAWAIQPSRDRAALRRTNVDGSARVFDAAVRAGVPALVYASSVGAYFRGPEGRPRRRDVAHRRHAELLATRWTRPRWRASSTTSRRPTPGCASCACDRG